MLGVSRSGYYSFAKDKTSQRSQDNQRLLQVIEKIHQASRGTYGSPRIQAALKTQGEKCSRKRVARIMHQAGLRAKMAKLFKITTRVNHKPQAAPICSNKIFRPLREINDGLQISVLLQPRKAGFIWQRY